MLSTSFYTGIATTIGFISGFVLNKIIATVIGPSGIALVSQFQNFVSLSTVSATGGISQGVVKYLSEKNSKSYRKKILSASLRITLFSSLVACVLILIFSSHISLILFKSINYAWIINIFACTVVLFALNNFLINILNGYGEIKKLVLVKISTNLFSLFFTSLSAYFYALPGALFAISISQSIIFFISLFFVLKSKWFKRKFFFSKIHFDEIKKLSQYALMAVTSMILTPLVLIGIRNHIISTISIDSAGYWDALNKISNSYLLIITTTLSIYYLPKLSSLKILKSIRAELINGYKILTPFLIIFILSIFFFRENLVVLLYSKSFLKTTELFSAQLLGDFFKILSWLLSYLMLAKAMTKLYITTEIIFNLFSYFLSIHMIDYIGLQGVVITHAIKYFIYLILMLIIFKKYIFK